MFQGYALLTDIKKWLRTDCLCNNYGDVKSHGDETMWTLKLPCFASPQIYLSHTRVIGDMLALTDRKSKEEHSTILPCTNSCQNLRSVWEGIQKDTVEIFLNYHINKIYSTHKKVFHFKDP
jgi:hypothetical protein